MLILIILFHYFLCSSLMIQGRQLGKDFVKIRDLWIESWNMRHDTKGKVVNFLGSRSYCLFKLLIIQVDLDSRLKFGFKIWIWVEFAIVNYPSQWLLSAMSSESASMECLELQKQSSSWFKVQGIQCIHSFRLWISQAHSSSSTKFSIHYSSFTIFIIYKP